MVLIIYSELMRRHSEGFSKMVGLRASGFGLRASGSSDGGRAMSASVYVSVHRRATGVLRRWVSPLFAVLGLVWGGLGVLAPGFGSAQSSGPVVLGPVGATDGCVLSVAGGSAVQGVVNYTPDSGVL